MVGPMLCGMVVVGCRVLESMGTRSLGRNLPHRPECPMRSRDLLLRGGDLGVEETRQIPRMIDDEGSGFQR